MIEHIINNNCKRLERKQFDSTLWYKYHYDSYIDVTLYDERVGDNHQLYDNDQYNAAYMKARVVAEFKMETIVGQRYVFYLPHTSLQENSLDEVIHTIDQACRWIIQRLKESGMSTDIYDWEPR